MTAVHPRLAPDGIAVGLGLPMAISFPGRTPGWSQSATPADMLRLARAADSLGYAFLTVSDHVVVSRRAAEALGATWYAPVPTLAYVAAATERIRLCTHVLVMPLRHPLAMARELGTLDHLSGGRLIIGAGTGHLRSEFAALGVDHERRGALTDEHLEQLERQWRGDTELVIEPAPLQSPRPRIWIGGNNARALRRAHRFADGWVPWQIELGALRALLDAQGHPGEVTLPHTIDPLGVAGAPQSADQCLDSLRTLHAAGVTAVTAGFPNRSLDELIAQMECFAGSVLPGCAQLG